MRVIPVRIVVFTTLISTVVGGCSGSGERSSPARQTATTRPEAASTSTANVQTPSSAERVPNGPWTDLARRLVESKNLETAVNVTQEVLARGGVATFDGDRVLVNVAMPAAAFQVSPLETVHMAMEARRRVTASRLTAAELAQMLEGFGWP
nr:hypothetical protein [Acidobacteriota bacterium]